VPPWGLAVSLPLQQPNSKLGVGEPLNEQKERIMSLNSELKPATSDRELRALAIRTSEAGRDAFAPAPPQLDNGDEARYPDKSGTYTKGIKQALLGVVDPAA
jgi:hypothetical protein